MHLATLPATKYVKTVLGALFGEAHWWPLTADATDVVGNLKVSQQAGVMSYQSFGNKPCIKFPGSAWFEIPAFDFGTKWSLSTWYAPIDFANYTHLFCSAADLQVDGIKFKLGAQTDPEGMPYLFVQNAGRSQVGASRVKAGVWSLITVTYEAGVLKLYVNDVLDTTFNVTIRVAKAPFRVGGGVETNQFSKGYQRDIRVWDKAIDLNTIKQIVARG